MVRLLKSGAIMGSSVAVAGIKGSRHIHGCCTMRRRALANSQAWIVDWEWESTLPVSGVQW